MENGLSALRSKWEQIRIQLFNYQWEESDR